MKNKFKLWTAAFLSMALAVQPMSVTVFAGDSNSEEPYTVTMLTQGEQQEDLPRILDKVNEILVKELNVKLNLIVSSYGSFSQQRQLMMTSGEPLDLVYLDAPSSSINFIKNGQIIDLNDLIDKYGDNITKYLGDNAKSANLDGFVYSVPNFNEVGSVPCIGMRKDLVEKYNIDPGSIKKLEDLEPVLKMIKENEPGIDPIHICADQPPVTRQLKVVDPMIDGVAVLDNGGVGTKNIISVTDSESYMDTCRLLHKWYEAGYINQDADTTTVQFESAFKAGSCFAAIMIWMPMSPQQFGGVDMVYAYLGDHLVQSGATSNAGYGISSNSQNPEKAMELLNYLYGNHDIVQLLDWGEEGKDWVYANDEKTLVTWPDGVDVNNATYHANLSWALPNQFMATSWEGVSDADAMEKMVKFNNEGIKSNGFGFTYDPTPIENELTALQNVRDKYMSSLETGSVDPDEYMPQYAEALKQAGIDKVIEEKQKQFDAWLASNNETEAETEG